MLIDRFAIGSVLVTRGKEGMSLITSNSAPLHLPALAREIFDVSGAGDTVAAVMAAGIAAGMKSAEAAELANVAAGIVVGKIGTAVVRNIDLFHALSGTASEEKNIIDKNGEEVKPEDLQSTLLELTVMSLTKEIKSLGVISNGLYFCGGGIHNKGLMKRIKKELGCRILTTADIGVDPDYLEATSFAWFAAQRIKGRKFDLSKVTGSNREVFLGVITEPAI